MTKNGDTDDKIRVMSETDAKVDSSTFLIKTFRIFKKIPQNYWQ